MNKWIVLILKVIKEAKTELETRGQNGDWIDSGKILGHMQDTWFQE